MYILYLKGCRMGRFHKEVKLDLWLLSPFLKN